MSSDQARSQLAEIIATLLNNGTSPTTGAKLLEKATVDIMFTNQVETFPDFARQGIPDAKPDLTNVIPEIYPSTGGSTSRLGPDVHAVEWRSDRKVKKHWILGWTTELLVVG